MEDVICRARIETELSKIVFKIIPIVSIIVMLLLHLIDSIDHYDYIKNTDVYEGESIISIFFSEFFYSIFLVYCWYGVLFYVTAFLLVWKWGAEYEVKCCSLQLDKDGVTGNKRFFFTNKNVKLPIEKVDSIAVKNGFIDKLYGGETIAINTSSGLICFMCVHNATEFVDKTLEAIKAYKESNKPDDVNIQTNTSSDNLEQIKKLKEMLDSGIITQDEFDTKKKQLLGL